VLGLVIAGVLGVFAAGLWLAWRQRGDAPTQLQPGVAGRLELLVLLEKRERQLQVTDELLVAAEALVGRTLERGYREHADPFEARFRDRTRALMPRVRQSFERCAERIASLRAELEAQQHSRATLAAMRKGLLYTALPGDPDKLPLLGAIRAVNRDWRRLAMMLDLVHVEVSRDSARRMVEETLVDVQEFLERPLREAKVTVVRSAVERIEEALEVDRLVAAVEELPELQRQIGCLRTVQLSRRVLELSRAD